MKQAHSYLQRAGTVGDRPLGYLEMQGTNFDKDFYLILGVQDDVSDEDLKKRFRQLAKQTHPDLNKSANAAENFKAIQEAYAVLGERSTRVQYDAHRQMTKHHYGTPVVQFDREARRAARESGRWQARNLGVFESLTRPRTIILLGLPLVFAGLFFSDDSETNKQKYDGARPGGAKSLERNSTLISLYRNPKTGEWERPDPVKAHTGLYDGWETKSMSRSGAENM